MLSIAEVEDAVLAHGQPCRVVMSFATAHRLFSDFATDPEVATDLAIATVPVRLDPTLPDGLVVLEPL